MIGAGGAISAALGGGGGGVQRRATNQLAYCDAEFPAVEAAAPISIEDLPAKGAQAKLVATVWATPSVRCR